MFYLLQKSFRFQLFVLIATTLLCLYQVLTVPLTFCACDSFLPYAVTLKIAIVQHPTLTTVMFTVLLLLQLLLLFLLFKQNRFGDQKSLLPCIFYTVFVGISLYSADQSIITPVFIVNFVTTALFVLANGSDAHRHKSRILVAGTLIGIATLYDLTAFLLFLALLFMLFTNHANPLKDTFVALIGVVVPYIYVLAYHFLVGDLGNYLSAWAQWHFHFPLWTSPPPLSHAITLIASILLIIYLLVRLKLQFDYKLILARKRLLNMIFLFVILVIMLGISNQPFPFSLGYLLVPLAIFFTAYATTSRFSFTKELLLTILCGSLGFLLF